VFGTVTRGKSSDRTLRRFVKIVARFERLLFPANNQVTFSMTV
jgi:hypothetical protein